MTTSVSQLVRQTEYLHPTRFTGLDPRRPITADELDFYLNEPDRDLQRQDERMGKLPQNDRLLLEVIQQLRGALRGKVSDFSAQIPQSSYSRDGVQYGRILGEPLFDRIADELPLLAKDPDLRKHTSILIRMLELRVGLRKTLGDHKNLGALLSGLQAQELTMSTLRGVSDACSSAIGNIVTRYREDYDILPREARAPEACRQIGQWACDQTGKPLDFHFSYRSSTEDGKQPLALRVIRGGKA